jgi:hypothetical protein
MESRSTQRNITTAQMMLQRNAVVESMPVT